MFNWNFDKQKSLALKGGKIFVMLQLLNLCKINNKINTSIHWKKRVTVRPLISFINLTILLSNA
jgi:hypothetical protein